MDGTDAIVRIVLAHTVKEKFEVNFCFKNVINLKKHKRDDRRQQKMFKNLDLTKKNITAKFH